MNNRLRTGLLSAFACAVSWQAPAAYIGINFQDDWGSGGGAAVTDAALGITANNWFNMVRVPNSGSGALSTNQVVALPGGGQLEVSWQAVNTWSLTADIPTLGDDQVIYGYLDDSGVGYAVTIKGFRNFASNYQIAAIAASDSASGFADTIVSFQTETNNLQYLSPQAPSYASGLWGLSSTSAPVSTLSGNNSVLITGAAKSSGIRSTLAGLIIEYTPGGSNPPMVEGQPKTPAGTIFTGQPFALSVEASGSAPLQYQWRKNGAPILNATNSTYSVASATDTDTGNYDVQITNGGGSTNSVLVSVAISELKQPVISAAPLSETVFPGYPVTLRVQASGGQLRYYWSKDGTPLPAGTNAILTFMADAASVGTYSVLVSNVIGTATAIANVAIRTPTPGTYEAAVASRRPELYFRMNETTATTQPPAINSGSLGASANGMYVGAVTRPVPGALAANTNTAASFSGGRVAMAYSPAANPNGSFTVEAWANPTDVAAGNRVLAQSMINGENPGNSNDRSGWAFRQSANTLQVLLGGQNVYNDTITALGAVTPGVWGHYAFVFDATANTLSILVNGVVVTNVTPGFPLEPNTAAPVLIGDRGYGGWGFKGALDEIAIYDKALTAAQLLAHYQNGINNAPATPYQSLVTADGPLIYARLSEGPFLPNAANQGTLGAAWNGTFSDASGSLGSPLIRVGEAGPRTPAFVAFESTNTAMSVTNGYLVAPRLDLGSGVTVAGWLYRETPENDGDLGWVAWLGDGGFHINHSDGELRYHWKGARWDWSSGLRVPLNAWTFVALVVQSNQATIYMSDAANSNLLSAINSASHAPMATTSLVGFGGNQPDRADRHFRGKEDEFAVWNRALGSDEIGYLFAASIGNRLQITLVPGGIVEDTAPGGVPNYGYNRGSGWVSENTDTAQRTRSGVQQFTAAGNSQIVLPATSELNSSAGTISFWMRAPAPIIGPGSEGAILFDRRALGNLGGGDILVLKDDGTLFVQAETPPGRTSANTFAGGYLPDDLWHHVAYVYDQSLSGSITLYVDGVSVGSNPNTTNWTWAADQPFELGRSHDTYWKRFEGFMDDFRIYDRALTPTEVAQLATDSLVDASALNVRFEFGSPGIGKSLVWPFGALESSTTLGASANWQPVAGATSPWPILPTQGNMFYRVRL